MNINSTTSRSIGVQTIPVSEGASGAATKPSALSSTERNTDQLTGLGRRPNSASASGANTHAFLSLGASQHRPFVPSNTGTVNAGFKPSEPPKTVPKNETESLGVATQNPVIMSDATLAVQPVDLRNILGR